MNSTELCADIGYMSINHVGENLCGDHVERVDQDERTTVLVLADGLGSGVKASILSTLTSKIISTMIAAGMKLVDAVETIAATLPVCSVRGVAYSTFTIVRLSDGKKAEIIQYDNPKVIMLRGGENLELPTVITEIGGKKIYRSEVELEEGDIFIAMSDGVEHAGVGLKYNFGWRRADIIEFMRSFTHVGFSAKTLTKILLDECNKLYDGKPGDDATVLTVRIRERMHVNLMIGPPSDPAKTHSVMEEFFGTEGKHVVCGGTTSTLAAEYLGRPLVPDLHFYDPEIPPTAEIKGVDLVTEGVITINRVLEYAKNYIADNSSYEEWSQKRDGASRIARILFEDATDVKFFVGRAVNPAHQNPNLPINFNIKMRLIEELSQCLEKMGKRVTLEYN